MFSNRVPIFSASPIIWFFGDSIIHWTLLYWQGLTDNRPEFFPFHYKIRNFAERGHKFHQVIQALQKAIFNFAEIPCLIVVHVGTNNMGSVSTIQFKENLRQFLQQLADIINSSPIGSAQNYFGYVWSDIIPRLYYSFNNDPVKADTVRKMFNRKAHALIGPTGNRFVTHKSISYQCIANYRNDGKDPPTVDPIHLSPVGMDKFILNIAQITNNWAQAFPNFP